MRDSVNVRHLVLFLSTLAAAACSQEEPSDEFFEADPGQYLMDILPVAPGEFCQSGGLEFVSGLDSNQNGVLEPSEVQSRELLCNGDNGDNGSPGDQGPPGSDGEDGVDGDCDCLYEPVPIVPPDGEGQFVIDTSGGDGVSQGGGDGNDFRAETDYGSNGGNIVVYNTGSLSCDWTPEELRGYFGDHPVDVTEDTLVLHFPSVEEFGACEEGDLYQLGDSDTLYQWNGSEGIVVTGLHIFPGVTLTFPTLTSGDAEVRLANDLHNEGHITTLFDDVNSVDRISLILNMATYLGGPDSSIDLWGLDADDAGSGGDLLMDAEDEYWIANQGVGSIHNQGTFNTYGGAGVNGGSGGRISLDAEMKIDNVGALNTYGGSGSGFGSSGGDGGNITTFTRYGDTRSLSPYNAYGGKGDLNAGDGGDIDISIGSTGDLILCGELRAYGADSDGSGCAGECSAGDGGSIDVSGESGSILLANGADSSGGDCEGGEGGDGGSQDFDLNGYENGWYSDYQSVGDIEISGNLDASGGDGDMGGDAGDIDVEGDFEEVANQQQIIFYGYLEINTSGGDNAEGRGSGGDGGDVMINNDYSYNEIGYYGPGGAIANFAEINTSGGDSPASGGSAGSVEFLDDDYYGYLTPELHVVLNTGDIMATGGDGLEAGLGGDIVFSGQDRVHNTGALHAVNGVALSGATFTTSDAPHVRFYADEGVVHNAGSVTVKGMSSEESLDGGEGGLIEFAGASIENEGSLFNTGGDSMGTGGRGGQIFLYSLAGQTTNSAEVLDVSGGDGDPQGPAGRIQIDALNGLP